MSDFEHFELDIRWKRLLKMISETFGELEDIKDVIFLIGIQELGMGYKKLSKDEKVDVMHIGVCAVLVPYGYYQYEGRDKEGWPHFTSVSELPPMKEEDREILMKRAVIDYFEEK